MKCSARDTRLGRDVALKVLPAGVAEDRSRRARFEQEARPASALNHPNIVAVYDLGSSGGVAYIVTELVEGESLRDLINRGLKRSPETPDRSSPMQIIRRLISLARTPSRERREVARALARSYRRKIRGRLEDLGWRVPRLGDDRTAYILGLWGQRP